jgi:hypothetical protein
MVSDAGQARFRLTTGGSGHQGRVGRASGGRPVETDLDEISKA